MPDDDDFTFDFNDNEALMFEPLHMISLDDVYYVGHILYCSNGSVWLNAPYHVCEIGDIVELREVPCFQLDYDQEVIFVTNADEMRQLHHKHFLSLGRINNIPILVNGTRH
ncbi:hypothetical protein pEaSNUABM52_00215 [Erwinia phage pEp_SNUABM_52]|nr:hypothetical protein pEaSNUABM52_00215 [Erwinia phage pEp_SNUABM_52]